MKEKLLKPNVFTYHALIRLSDSFETGLNFLDEMILSGLMPNLYHKNSLLQIAAGDEEMIRLIGERFREI